MTVYYCTLGHTCMTVHHVHVQSIVHCVESTYKLCSHAGMIALCVVGALLLIGGGFAGELIRTINLDADSLLLGIQVTLLIHVVYLHPVVMADDNANELCPYPPPPPPHTHAACSGA